MGHFLRAGSHNQKRSIDQSHPKVGIVRHLYRQTDYITIPDIYCSTTHHFWEEVPATCYMKLSDSTVLYLNVMCNMLFLYSNHYFLVIFYSDHCFYLTHWT